MKIVAIIPYRQKYIAIYGAILYNDSTMICL